MQRKKREENEKNEEGKRSGAAARIRQISAKRNTEESDEARECYE